jgi:hypothetical protein
MYKVLSAGPTPHCPMIMLPASYSCNLLLVSIPFRLFNLFLLEMHCSILCSKQDAFAECTIAPFDFFLTSPLPTNFKGSRCKDEPTGKSFTLCDMSPGLANASAYVALLIAVLNIVIWVTVILVVVSG